MKKLISIISCFCMVLLLLSCNGDIKISKTLNQQAVINPDYKGVTIPVNIAPLNFSSDQKDKSCLILEGKNFSFQVRGSKGNFVIPPSKWQKLLNENKGAKIKLTVCTFKDGEWCAYLPFEIEIANEPIDKYIAYRLIPPGYQLWNQMGLYQRCLETYEQSPIYENKLTGNNCVNCHSFCMQNPQKMLFHSRAKFAGTILVNDGVIEKLNTKTDQTISALVYPSWHPSGNFIAFSTNKTKQIFHCTNRNRIEVFDSESDVMVYDIKQHNILTCPLLDSTKAFETFPTFSPDGKSLYFCSAYAVDSMPARFDQVHYSLCRIDFNPQTKTFGSKVDTLYNAVANGKSVSFPRVSPDGKYLVFTLHKYGNFSIWHKDADLYMVNLATRQITPLSAANSNDVDSYHSWSSNSRWLVFSSRRIDGLYTRPFITYIDKNGVAHKPFLLPQKYPVKFYKNLMFSYNLPEFIKDKVVVNRHDLAKTLKESSGTNLTFKETK
jgi:hypothetical protein